MSADVNVIQILLVEDNETDVMIAREAMREFRILNEIHHVEDGEEAMKFLRREEPYTSAPRPDLVLLDLNLPKKGGQEVLEEIKADPALLRIPVVILTTSKAEEDILRAYGLHANCYLHKPLNFDAFSGVIRSLEQFWLCVVTLPGTPL